MVTDTENTIRRILNADGFSSVTDQAFISAIEQYGEKGKDLGYKTRFNKGVIGRGDDVISNDQKTAILKVFSFYQNIDLTALGVIREEQFSFGGA